MPKRGPMNGYAFGFKVGIAQVGAGDVDNPTYVQGAATLTPAQQAKYGLLGTAGCTPLDRRCHTETRRGVNLSFPVQLGGPGLGIRIEPYMTLAAAAQAYGVYLGPTFEFHVVTQLYLGVGFGLKAAWVKVDPWKYAGDLYGRIPVSITWYAVDDLALVLEAGFGGGASAYFGEVKDIVNPTTGAKLARKADVTFGFGRTWDLSVGVRFP